MAEQQLATIPLDGPRDLLRKLVDQQAEILLHLRELRKERELPQQEWFSIIEAGALTGLHEDTIRRAVTGGTLPCSNVGTYDRPTYRISRKDIEAYMEKRKAGAFPPPRKSKKSIQLPVSRHARRPAGQPAA